MSIIRNVRDYLAADATLAGYLTGGLYAAVDVPGGEITRQATPAAFDEFGEILPCGLVNGGGDVPAGPTDHSGEMLVSVWLYHRTSDAANETAAARVRALLHKHPLPGTYEVRWASDGPVFFEDAPAARAAVTRYVVRRKL